MTQSFKEVWEIHGIVSTQPKFSLKSIPLNDLRQSSDK